MEQLTISETIGVIHYELKINNTKHIFNTETTHDEINQS